MKEVIVQIKFDKADMAFKVEKNFEETTENLLQLVGALDVIKYSQQEKIGEIKKK